jgi:hypothetical protein
VIEFAVFHSLLALLMVAMAIQRRDFGILTCATLQGFVAWCKWREWWRARQMERDLAAEREADRQAERERAAERAAERQANSSRHEGEWRR